MYLFIKDIVMRFRFCALLLVIISFMPLSASQANVTGCPTLKTDPSYMGDYPDYHVSPKQSVELHDAAFLGEVVVPLRKCSLGYCAGLRVLRNMKGQLESTVLIQVRKPDNQVCAPLNFTEKGQRWMVFANQGTSRKGHKYFYSDDQGPSFISRTSPDFESLEGRYMQMRANLDRAIKMRLR
jgi:hypothetical protein